MKKVILILCLFLLSGCDNAKVNLSVGNGEIIKINSERLKQLEDDGESFVLFISLPSCPTANEFKNMLTSYVKDKQINIYQIYNTEIDNTLISQKIKYFPTLVICKNGKVMTYLKADSDQDKQYYENVQSLDNWFNKYVLLENL